MLDVFAAAGAEQRLYGWFAREEEEQVARELGIDGAMKADNIETTEVGIFLNDAAVSKLEYYLSTSVSVACDPAARTVTTSITMTNSVDRDDLTYHILALRSPRYGGSQTSMLFDVLYFAPPGATIIGVDPGVGRRRRSRPHQHGGAVATRRASPCIVDRGQTRTVSYTSALPEGELGPDLGALQPDGHRHARHDRTVVHGADRPLAHDRRGVRPALGRMIAPDLSLTHR